MYNDWYLTPLDPEDILDYMSDMLNDSNNHTVKKGNKTRKSLYSEHNENMISRETIAKLMIDSRKELETSIRLSISMDDDDFKALSLTQMFYTFVEEIKETYTRVTYSNSEYENMLINMAEYYKDNNETLKRRITFLEELPTGEKIRYKDEVKKGWKVAYKHSVQPDDVLQYYNSCKNISEVAERFHISKPTVYSRLREAGWQPDKKRKQRDNKS